MQTIRSKKILSLLATDNGLQENGNCSTDEDDDVSDCVSGDTRPKKKKKQKRRSFIMEVKSQRAIPQDQELTIRYNSIFEVIHAV